MSKELEALERLKTAPSFMGGTVEYQFCTKSETLLLQDYETIKQALQRLEAIDNANPSEALEELIDMIEYFTRLDYVEPIVRNEIHDKFKDIYWHKLPHLDSIKEALLKIQEPKQYLKWEDLEFSYGTKTQKVRMVDTIYKIVYANYDNTKEVQLLSEDEKCYYIGFTGNYKDNVQLFNDLHLEMVEE